MSFTVRVIRNDMPRAFKRFSERLVEEVLIAAQIVAVEVIEDIAGRSPELSGDYVRGWTDRIPEIMAGGGSEYVNVFNDADFVGLEVTNPVEYGIFVEYGTADRPGANAVAVSLEAVRRRLVYGRGANSITAAIERAWEAV